MADLPLAPETLSRSRDGKEPTSTVSLPESLDHALHNWQSRVTGGRSPSTVTLAFMDWAAHTANAPFKTASRAKTAFTQWQRLGTAMLGGEPVGRF
jgi:polyhydroxyalkanoate synthase